MIFYFLGVAFLGQYGLAMLLPSFAREFGSWLNSFVPGAGTVQEELTLVTGL